MSGSTSGGQSPVGDSTRTQLQPRVDGDGLSLLESSDGGQEQGVVVFSIGSLEQGDAFNKEVDVAVSDVLSPDKEGEEQFQKRVNFSCIPTREEQEGPRDRRCWEELQMVLGDGDCSECWDQQ